MLKFRNKFKFGGSSDKQEASPSESPRHSLESRKTVSTNLLGNLTDNVSKLSMNDANSSGSLPGSAAGSVTGSVSVSGASSSNGVSSNTVPNTTNSSSTAAISSATSTTANTTANTPTNTTSGLGQDSVQANGHTLATTEGTSTNNSAPLNLIIPNSLSSKSGKSISPASSSTNVASPSSSSPDTSNPGLLTVKIYNSQAINLPVKINNNVSILQALAVNANHESIKQELLQDLQELPNDELLNDASKYLPSIITIPNQNLIKSLLYLTIEFDNNVLVIEPQKGTVQNSTWNQVVSFDVSKKTGTGESTLNVTSPPSSPSKTTNTDSIFLNLNLFIRLPNILIPEHEKSAKKQLFTNYGSNQKYPNNIGDLLIGTIKLPLNLKCHKSPIRLMNHEFLNFINSNLQDSIMQQMGQIMLTIEFKPVAKSHHLTIDDFDLLKVIGKGSFGKVMQVVKKDTKQIYALKTLRKQHIVSRMEVTHTLAERTVLARVTNPFIVPLKFSFQSPEKLYLVLSFINGGELFWHLQMEGKFSMDRSRFYIAELLTALESVHELNVIYRDLKPENILLDYQGHIALCDFGLCKLNMKDNDKTNTFCGTPEYLAPELLLNQGYTRSVDWWTLGTLLYEMLTGLPPFYDEDTPTMYKKILQDPLKFPPALDRTDAKDLLIKLLQKDPKHRLDDANDIKSHPFFKDIDWNKLLNKSYLPPFKPNVENLLDTSNFDQDFTNEKPQDSVVDDFLTESVQKQFGGWTYNGDAAF